MAIFSAPDIFSSLDDVKIISDVTKIYQQYDASYWRCFVPQSLRQQILIPTFNSSPNKNETDDWNAISLPFLVAELYCIHPFLHLENLLNFFPLIGTNAKKNPFLYETDRII